MRPIAAEKGRKKEGITPTLKNYGPMAPQVSILLPAFNAADTIGPAVRSVLAQTFTAWELLLVDDGSTDGPWPAAEAAARTDPRVRLIRRDHAGLVPTLNAALSLARAPFVARFDADDLMHRTRLARQVEVLQQQPAVAVVGSLVRCFPRAALTEGMERYESWLNSLVTHEDIVRDLFVESPFAHPSVMMRRDRLEAVGGYLDHGWPEDYDLWLRFHQAGARFAKVPKVLHFWRDRPYRLSRTSSVYALRQFRNAKIHYLRQGFLRGSHTVQIWGAGRGGKVWSRALEAQGFRVARHVDIDPHKIGRTLRGAPVISPDALPQHRHEPLLVAVGVKGARELIRARLAELGFVEGRDFVCVA